MILHLIFSPTGALLDLVVADVGFVVGLAVGFGVGVFFFGTGVGVAEGLFSEIKDFFI